MREGTAKNKKKNKRNEETQQTEISIIACKSEPLGADDRRFTAQTEFCQGKIRQPFTGIERTLWRAVVTGKTETEG